jgi:hypothetical protein
MKTCLIFFEITMLLIWSPVVTASAQDLSGLSICIDPGHGQGTANQGPTGLREAEINLSVSLFLKEFLQSADIDTVLLTRVDNSTNPTLSQREDLANSFAVDWFHSIHHNACGAIGAVCTARYTLLLIEEVRALANPCPDGRTRGTGQPEWPGLSDEMSDLMANWIFEALRTSFFTTRLDWTFFGGCNGGFSLGVLNDLLMPGELSEATFHQNLIEENKLRNPDFLKLEARALFMAFLDFYEAGTLSTGALTGIITNEESGEPINGAEVLLIPVGASYTTDDYNNGLYVFHDVPPGTYQVTASAEGFESKELTVEANAHDFSFLDFSLASASPPVSVGPANAETQLPQEFALYQNFPNPFNPETVISYQIPEDAFVPQKVVLKIYNLQGQNVRTLVEDKQPPGTYTVFWDGKNDFGEIVSSGLYIYQIKIGRFIQNNKMIFLK